MDRPDIDMAKLTYSVWHLQDGNKQDVMAVVEAEKQVYIFYKAPYQYNTDYLEAFKSHLTVSKDHKGSMVYHPGLAAAILLEKYNITTDTAREKQKIEANIKSRVNNPPICS